MLHDINIECAPMRGFEIPHDIALFEPSITATDAQPSFSLQFGKLIKPW
jgi:hypothetical protein